MTDNPFFKTLKKGKQSVYKTMQQNIASVVQQNNCFSSTTGNGQWATGNGQQMVTFGFM